MAIQPGSNFRVMAKVEGTFNTAPGATGATTMRVNDSPGMDSQFAMIASGERRSDQGASMDRLGSRKVPGSFNCEMGVGFHDMWYEAIRRSTWVAAVAITVDGSAANASFEVTANNQITYVGTTTILTKGLRVGDVVRLTNMSTAGNNSINLRVKSINAAGLVIGFHGTPLTVQGADSAATMTILKKLSMGATPTERTFYVDQYYATLDQSLVAGGVKYIAMKITGSPDGMAMVEFTALGASLTPLATGASPYFTSSTLPTGTALVFADCTLSLGGTDIAIGTAFELNYIIAADTLAVIGSSVTPGVFANTARLSGSLSLAREDLTRVTALGAETEYELHVLLVEPESEPKDCQSIFVPRVKLTGVKSPLGGDGAQIEQLPWVSGVKEGASATGYDTTDWTMCSSAA